MPLVEIEQSYASELIPNWGALVEAHRKLKGLEDALSGHPEIDRFLAQDDPEVPEPVVLEVPEPVVLEVPEFTDPPVLEPVKSHPSRPTPLSNSPLRGLVSKDGRPGEKSQEVDLNGLAPSSSQLADLAPDSVPMEDEESDFGEEQGGIFSDGQEDDSADFEEGSLSDLPSLQSGLSEFDFSDELPLPTSPDFG